MSASCQPPKDSTAPIINPMPSQNKMGKRSTAAIRRGEIDFVLLLKPPVGHYIRRYRLRAFGCSAIIWPRRSEAITTWASFIQAQPGQALWRITARFL
jgi:hypothetical protein